MKNVAFCVALLAGSWTAGARAAEPAAGHAVGAKGAEVTCGQMLADMSSIPAKYAEGADAVADVWEAHAALLGKDKEAQAEVKGLRSLAKSHKQIATSLKKVSEEMKKASAWPAAPHDMAKMKADSKLDAATRRLLTVQKEIIAMLQKSVAEMEDMHKPAK